MKIENKKRNRNPDFKGWVQRWADQSEPTTLNFSKEKN